MRRMRDETSLIIPAVRAVLDEALAAGRRTTDGGKAIDEHQVHAERLAYAATEAAAAEARLREIGREIIRTRGANNCFIDGEMAEMARDSARSFARKEVAPIAERI